MPSALFKLSGTALQLPWQSGKQNGYRVKSGSPRHEARCPSAANTAELRKRIRLSKSGQTLVAVEIVEMR